MHACIFFYIYIFSSDLAVKTITVYVTRTLLSQHTTSSTLNKILHFLQVE